MAHPDKLDKLQFLENACGKRKTRTAWHCTGLMFGPRDRNRTCTAAFGGLHDIHFTTRRRSELYQVSEGSTSKHTDAEDDRGTVFNA